MSVWQNVFLVTPISQEPPQKWEQSICLSVCEQMFVSAIASAHEDMRLQIYQCAGQIMKADFEDGRCLRHGCQERGGREGATAPPPTIV